MPVQQIKKKIQFGHTHDSHGQVAPNNNPPTYDTTLKVGPKLFYAGPATGISMPPTFRRIQATDLADAPSASKYLRGDMTWATIDNLITAEPAPIEYNTLTGIPTTFAPSAHTHAFNTITGTPTTLAGYGITDAIQGYTFTDGLTLNQGVVKLGGVVTPGQKFGLFQDNPGWEQGPYIEFPAYNALVLGVWDLMKLNKLTIGSVTLDYTYDGNSRFSVHNATGDVKINNLSGQGDRMVVADLDGILKTQAIPGIPTLQQVVQQGDFTNQGNVIYKDITFTSNGNLTALVTPSSGTITAKKLRVFETTNTYGQFEASGITGQHTYYVPNKSGTVALTSDTIQRETITLSSSDLLGLTNGVGINVIPAPGAGKVIVLHSVIAQCLNATTAYQEYIVNLSYLVGGDSLANITVLMYDTYAINIVKNIQNNRSWSYNIENKPLVLINNSNGAPFGGDGNLKLIVEYTVVDL